LITLREYYYRPEWQLFDRKQDPAEVYNVAGKVWFEHIFADLRKKLFAWQKATDDPWLCSPHSVLEDSGPFKHNSTCLPLFN